MFHLIKNLWAEFRAAAETVAQDTFLNKFLHTLPAMLFEGKKNFFSFKIMFHSSGELHTSILPAKQ